MILYTVVPLEDVLEGIESEPAPSQELVLNGLQMEVEPLDNFQAKVVRVISSNPADYLHPEYQPGSIVRLF